MPNVEVAGLGSPAYGLLVTFVGLLLAHSRAVGTQAVGHPPITSFLQVFIISTFFFLRTNDRVVIKHLDIPPSSDSC